MNTDRREWIRRQAITIFELTKGFTPEQRQNFSNELTSLEEMSGYVLELTNQLKQRDETIKQLKEALKTCIDELMYVSTTGHLWMWARSNGKVPERLLNARKLVYDELNTPEK